MKIRYSLILFMLGVLSGVLINFIYQDIKDLKYFTSESLGNNNCSDLNLEQTAKCLRNEVADFYYYNISNKNNTGLSQEELKSEGGVCWQYADYYIRRAVDLGFYSKNINFWSDGTTNRKGNKDYIGHSIAMIWDKDLSGYCFIDQTEYYCFKFGNLNRVE